MNSEQISRIIREKAVPHPTEELRLIETHISWVLLGDRHVYKIKKPLALNFLDFSNPDKRRLNCRQEVLLNRRLAPEMYLGVLPVAIVEDKPRILSEPIENEVVETDPGTGDQNRESMKSEHSLWEIVDYAVWMRRMDETRQLDILLEAGQVTGDSIAELARILSGFHKAAPVIYEAENWEDIYDEFRDLQSVITTLSDLLGKGDGDRIRMVIGNSWKFLQGHAERIETRKASGFVRDGHGDLHCRNVLMTQPPVVFDCIEFSEQLRTLDVLSEIGFLCMDLERYGRMDLSEVFCQTYESEFPCIQDIADRQLFTFYKMYRANVRLKVETLVIDRDTSRMHWQEESLTSRLKSYSKCFLRYADQLGLLTG